MKKLLISLSMTAALFGAIPEPKPEEKKIDTKPYDETIFEMSRTFAQITQLVGEKHYHVDNAKDSMMKAFEAFIGNMDKHSAFLDPETYQAMMEATSGELIGIGVKIDNMRKPSDKFLTIVETIPDGPADKAGMEAMDKIMEIEGKPLEGMTTEEAITKLKGERNTQVTIKVLRDKEKDLLTFTITRDIVENESSLSFQIKQQDIYYLSLSSFSSNTLAQVEKLLKEASKKHYKGIILDLRNNSGGLLTSVIDIAGLFIDKGSLVVTTKGKDGKVQQRYTTTREPIANSAIPIFILINNFTASAAEILAGTLRVYSSKAALSSNGKQQNKFLVFIVGTTSYGKGSVQEVIPLDNYAIKLTTSLYFLPNDKTVQGEGVQPDFFIERTFAPTEQMQWFTKYYGRESGMGNYIKADGNKEETKAVPQSTSDSAKASPDKQDEREGQKKEEDKKGGWLKRAQTMINTDNQVRETISLINLFNTFKKTCPNNVCNREKAVEFLKQHHLTNEILEIEAMS